MYFRRIFNLSVAMIRTFDDPFVINRIKCDTLKVGNYELIMLGIAEMAWFGRSSLSVISEVDIFYNSKVCCANFSVERCDEITTELRELEISMFVCGCILTKALDIKCSLVIMLFL